MDGIEALLKFPCFQASAKSFRKWWNVVVTETTAFDFEYFNLSSPALQLCTVFLRLNQLIISSLVKGNRGILARKCFCFGTKIAPMVSPSSAGGYHLCSDRDVISPPLYRQTERLTSVGL